MAIDGSSKNDTMGQVMNMIYSKLPYTSPLNNVDPLDVINPKYKLFYGMGSNKAQMLNRQAVSTPKMDTHPMGGITIDKNYSQFMYANVDFDKTRRLLEYRIMAQFAEVADALDEICDAFLNKDEHNEIVKLNLRNFQHDEKVTTIVNKELQKFLQKLDLEGKGWEYIRMLLMDGELYFENVVSQKEPDKGILGFINIPCELIDPVYENVQNLLIKGYLLRKPFAGNSKTEASKRQSTTGKFELIPMEKNQILYINSGIWNQSKTIRVPFIENARRAYRQLSLIEDSIIIYRLVRAPERLVFNVDVGDMPKPKAEAYLKKLMNNFWSKKSYDAYNGSPVLTYNPQSMMDAFWFAKRQGGEGTTVTTLAAGQNLGQLDDLNYFIKKLYKSLKVPVTRLNPEDTTNDSATILREELKFANFIIRLQRTFAAGLRPAFITQLKLKGLLETYEIAESDVQLEFVPPTNYYELRQNQILELKFANFGQVSSNEMFSTSFAMKKYLGWSDVDIKANREWLKKDAGLKWELAQIVNSGPDWEQKQAEPTSAEGQIAGFGGGGGGGAPGGAPPAFTPLPGAEGGTPAPGTAPEGGEAAAPTPAPGAEASALPT